ncbi:MAG: branched-chain amino acid ABC transporter permease [Jiangellaceae bacterium]
MPNVSELLTGPLARRAALAVAACALLAYPWLAPNSYLRYVGVLVVMYAVLATSWNLVGGFTGYVSLGHAAFFGLGAYGTGLLVTEAGLDHLVALGVSAVGVALFAVVVGTAAVRVRGASFVIVSIALVAMMSLLAQDARELTGGSSGLRVPAISQDLDRTSNHVLSFYLFAALLFLALLTWWFIDRSRFGAGLKAIREDEDKAEALGVPTMVYKVAVFGLSAGFTGVAGGLYGMWFGSLDPIFVFSIIVGANMVLMALLGGVRHLLGPTLGAMIVAPTGEYFLTRFGETQLHIVLSGVLLAVVVLFMPDGIIPAVRSLGRRFGPRASSIREESQQQVRDRQEVTT